MALTTRGSSLQSISTLLTNETDDLCARRTQDSGRRTTKQHILTRMAIKEGKTCSKCSTNQYSKAPVRLRSVDTHHKNSQTNDAKTIDVDHIATTNICSLLFRGICAGTKLSAVVHKVRIPPTSTYVPARITHSTLAWKDTTGLRGVETDVVNDVSLSLRVEAEMLRDAAAKVLRVSIWSGSRVDALRRRVD